ncbi:polymorphic toxin-type HINT domain-containing protein [Kitasatospora phosalacinea]|uniref:Polymorphic toxin-type HINT domain-containing protein n=1 Tax=Kitasatospora phosalacinea TaxID=2065 RepID=A0ABW6GWM6_9ACTN
MKQPKWPTGSKSKVDFNSAAGNRSSSAPGQLRAGASPVRVGATDRPATARGNAPQAPADPVSSVDVQVADRSQARAANVDGLLVGLSRADGKQGDGGVSVALDYSDIAQAYGGGWASRLKLVAMPGCALTTPQVAECRKQTPVEYVNDPVSQSISGTVDLAADSGSSVTAKSAFATPMSLTVADSGTAVAAVADTGGSQGSYGTTSLSASGSWSGTASGAFNYAYPIDTPAALSGAAPGVSLSYNSQAVDGETSARNSQSSMIGDGWDYNPGYIERSYRPCGSDGIKDSADSCWAGWNATISLGPHTGELVRDAAGQYHLQSEDGTRIERLTGASNGLWQGEYFKVTTTDGTAYYLGLNHAPGTTSDSATNSAWGVPVYHPKSGDPCYDSAKGDKSQCAQQVGYRFNLDFVVDPNGNVQRYDWATESNYYNMGFGQVAASGSGGTLTQYTRGGRPTQISYGYKLADEIAGREPSAKVVFNSAQRCVVSDTTCQASNLSGTTAANWPDTPYDLNCPSTAKTSGTGSDVCLVGGPTFWSTYRLKSIDTKVRDASGWKDVDSYELTQVFSDAGGTYDPVTGKTQNSQSVGALQSMMWLQSIKHTGKDTTAGGSGPLALDPITFTGIEIDNRVDGLTPAAPPLFHPRISSVQTETGESVAVTYRAPECSRVNHTMPASADSNTMACYPVWWNTPGAKDPISDWFHKTLVSQISASDLTKAGSPAHVTNYTYSGGAAWHRDDSDLTDDKYRTWNEFRGYRTVTTTTGAAPDPITQNSVSYLQGMDGDYKADGSRRSIKLSNSLGEQITDSPWLTGLQQESAVYTQAGGTVTSKSLVDEPAGTLTTSRARTAWTSADPAPAQLSALPDLTARRMDSTSARTMSLLSDGTTWRTTKAKITYDSLSRVTQVDDQGDINVPSQESCTTTSYAPAPVGNPMMLAYPSETISIAGPCGTPATSTTVLSQKRIFYDGPADVANPGTYGVIGQNGTTFGYPTASQAAASYDASNHPVFQTLGAVGYDGYGRPVKNVDAAGAVTTLAYSPATGTPPTTVSTTNPLGWTSSSTAAVGRGLTVHAVDANGKVTDSTYDALGRRTAVWNPGRDKATQTPDNKFTYAVHGAGANPDPSTVTTETLREDQTYSVQVSIYDGMLQARQVQTTTADNSAGRLIASTFYDSHGWAVSSIAPYADTTTAPGTTLFIEDNKTGPSTTRTAYDGMGRPTTNTLVSGASTLWSTTTYKGADRVDVTPPTGGRATTTYTNALGQTTSSVVRDTTADKKLASGTVIPSGSFVLSKSTRLEMRADGNLVLTALIGGATLWSSNTGGNPGAFASVEADGDFVVWNAAKTVKLWSAGTGGHTGGYAKVQGDANLVVFDAANTALWSTNTANAAQPNDVTTGYTYTNGGNLDTVKDSAGNTWSYSYDLRGRLLSQTDPDTGTSTTTYDNMGRVATTTDPRGQALSYTYDTLSRRTGEYSGTSTTDSSKLLAEWTYDGTFKGLPDASTRYVGGKNGSAYVNRIDSYNSVYQPTSLTTVIPAAEGKLAGTYTATNIYTTNIGLLGTTTFGSEGGLPSETVGYGYNKQGGLVSVGSQTTTYLADVLYSPLGQTLQTTIGDDLTKQLRTAQTWDAATGRLATNKVTLQNNAANPISNTTYTYDQAGNPTAASDVQSSGGIDRTTDTQCYQYDAQDRLVTAWTDTKGLTAVTTGQIGRCTTANPTASTVGCPAPYWQNWQYNRLGDRTQQVTHDVTGNAAKNTTQISVFPGNDTTATATPNAVSTITTANPTTGTYTQTPQYDTAGNVKARATAGSKSTSQTIGYDEEGHTKSVTTDGKTATYLYGAGGNLLLQRGPATSTLYLFGGTEQLTVDNVASTHPVTGQRYYRAPDGTTTVRSSNGTITYQPTGAQGTAQLQVDAATLAITRRAYDPYGNPRGATPSAWADNHGYLGKPQDATSGLDLLGARQYDPTIGRFLSPDPLFQAGDPNQMGGYAYSGDNPVTFSDPSGLSVWSWLHTKANQAGTVMAGGIDSIVGQPYQLVVNGLSSGWNSFADVANGDNEWFNRTFDYKKTPFINLPHTGKVDDKPIGHLFNADTNSQTYEAGRIIGTIAGLAVDGITVFKAGQWGVRAIKGANAAIEEAGGAISWVKRLFKSDEPTVTPKTPEPAKPPTTTEPTAPETGTGTGESSPSTGTTASEGSGSGASTATEAKAGAGAGETACSFSPDTPVLMGNGTTKPIAEITPGDQVEAADPDTGTDQGARTVTATWINHDEDLVDLTIQAGDGTDQTIHTTSKHPFWDATTNTWVPASQLVPGVELATDAGAHIRIKAVTPTPGTADRHNLTVTELHTYYVLAGTTPVLVHNCDLHDIARAESAKSNTSNTAAAVARDTYTGVWEYGESGMIPAEVHPVLAERLEALIQEHGSLEEWPPGECAEFNACNNLLQRYASVNPDEVEYATIFRKTGENYPSCDNCRNLLHGANMREAQY